MPQSQSQSLPLSLTRINPTTAIVTRHFFAPPARVFACHTDPGLIRQWLHGPDGWTMTDCEIDPTPGGKARYAWTADDGSAGFHLTAENGFVEAPHRITHTERMFLPDPTPDMQVETLFLPADGGTRMVMTLHLPSADAMDAMLATGMEHGMEASYQRLDALA